MATQFLTFVIENTTYAFEVNHVQEVLEWMKPVKIPCAADYVEGLINSRNQGISLINLRRRFGLEWQDVTKRTRIIVLELPAPLPENESAVQLFGVVADAVNEVITLDEGEIEQPPKFGNAISPEFIVGLGKHNGLFVTLLDPEKIFDGYNAVEEPEPPQEEAPAEE